jgi:chromosome segregation ATPase
MMHEEYETTLCSHKYEDRECKTIPIKMDFDTFGWILIQTKKGEEMSEKYYAKYTKAELLDEVEELHFRINNLSETVVYLEADVRERDSEIKALKETRVALNRLLLTKNLQVQELSAEITAIRTAMVNSGSLEELGSGQNVLRAEHPISKNVRNVYDK